MPQGSHTARTNNSTVTYTIAPNKKFAGQHSSLKHLPVRSPGHSPLGVRSKLKNGSFKLLKAGSFDLHQAKYGGTRRNIVESNSQRSGDMVAKTTAPHMTTKKETEKISALQHNSEAKMVLKSSDYQKIASTNVKQSRNQEKVDDRRARELNRPNPALFIPKAKLQGATKFNNSNTNQTDYLSVPSPIIGQLDLATPTVRPGTTILRHHSLENLPECDPEWLQQCRGKIHRRIHHKPDDPVKYQDGNTPKSSPKDPKHQMLSPGKQKSSEEADLSVRSGTATVRNSRFQLKNLPCISPRDFAADSHQQSGLIDNMVGKSPQRSYYSQAEKRWKSDSKLRSLQKANQLMQAGANAQAANLKVVSSDYSSSDSITSNHSGHNNKSPLHKSHSDGQSKCRCTCECCIKGCWPNSSPNLVIVGRKAPDFTGFALMRGVFDEISLMSYRGKYLVLSFCHLNLNGEKPTDVLAFSNRLDDFRRVGSEVIICSTDKNFGPKLWTTTPVPSVLSGIRIPLLADESHDIARIYGVASRNGQILRGTFIVDERGLVRQIILSDVAAKLSIDELLRLVQQFKSSDKPSGRGA